MNWILRIGDIFILIWTFGNATNGTYRSRIILIGGIGTFISLLVVGFGSLITKEWWIVTALIEYTFVFIISLAIFGFIFRKIQKPEIRFHEPTTKEMIEEIRKNK